MSQNNNAVLGDLKVIVSWCFSLQQQATGSLSILFIPCSAKIVNENHKIESVLSRTLSQLSTIDGCFVGEFQHESVFLVGLYLRECDQKATPEVFEPRIACRMDRQDGRTISANTGIENRLVIGCEPSL